jgi:O-methyltransferase/aklanonic acid methyltransferase
MPEPRVLDKQTIQGVFDGAAEMYDRVGPGLFVQWGERLVECLGLAPGERLLDVATGAGAALLPAARRLGPEGRAVGVDLSGEILKRVVLAAQAEGLSNVELRRMDAERLEFANESFDAVTCAFSLFMFPDMQAALAEMRRVLMPGGRLGVSVFARTPPPFDPGWPLFAQQAVAYGVAQRMPQRVTYSPEEIQPWLGGFTFDSIETHYEVSEVVYTSAEDWWAFQLTLGNRATILGMDIETRARFKEEYLEKIRPLLQEDGLHLSVGVVYALARKLG